MLERKRKFVFNNTTSELQATKRVKPNHPLVLQSSKHVANKEESSFTFVWGEEQSKLHNEIQQFKKKQKEVAEVEKKLQEMKSTLIKSRPLILSKQLKLREDLETKFRSAWVNPFKYPQTSVDMVLKQLVHEYVEHPLLHRRFIGLPEILEIITTVVVSTVSQTDSAQNCKVAKYSVANNSNEPNNGSNNNNISNNNGYDMASDKSNNTVIQSADYSVCTGKTVLNMLNILQNAWYKIILSFPFKNNVVLSKIANNLTSHKISVSYLQREWKLFNDFDIEVLTSNKMGAAIGPSYFPFWEAARLVHYIWKPVSLQALLHSGVITTNSEVGSEKKNVEIQQQVPNVSFITSTFDFEAVWKEESDCLQNCRLGHLELLLKIDECERLAVFYNNDYYVARMLAIKGNFSGALQRLKLDTANIFNTLSIHCSKSRSSTDEICHSSISKRFCAPEILKQCLALGFLLMFHRCNYTRLSEEDPQHYPYRMNSTPLPKHHSNRHFDSHTTLYYLGYGTSLFRVKNMMQFRETYLHKFSAAKVTPHLVHLVCGCLSTDIGGRGTFVPRVLLGALLDHCIYHFSRFAGISHHAALAKFNETSNSCAATDDYSYQNMGNTEQDQKLGIPSLCFLAANKIIDTTEEKCNGRAINILHEISKLMQQIPETLCDALYLPLTVKIICLAELNVGKLMFCINKLNAAKHYYYSLKIMLVALKLHIQSEDICTALVNLAYKPTNQAQLDKTMAILIERLNNDGNLLLMVAKLIATEHADYNNAVKICFALLELPSARANSFHMHVSRFIAKDIIPKVNAERQREINDRIMHHLSFFSEIWEICLTYKELQLTQLFYYSIATYAVSSHLDTNVCSGDICDAAASYFKPIISQAMLEKNLFYAEHIAKRLFECFPSTTSYFCLKQTFFSVPSKSGKNTISMATTTKSIGVNTTIIPSSIYPISTDVNNTNNRKQEWETYKVGLFSKFVHVSNIFFKKKVIEILLEENEIELLMLFLSKTKSYLDISYYIVTYCLAPYSTSEQKKILFGSIFSIVSKGLLQNTKDTILITLTNVDDNTATTNNNSLASNYSLINSNRNTSTSTTNNKSITNNNNNKEILEIEYAIGLIFPVYRDLSIKLATDLLDTIFSVLNKLSFIIICNKSNYYFIGNILCRVHQFFTSQQLEFVWNDLYSNLKCSYQPKFTPLFNFIENLNKSNMLSAAYSKSNI